MSEDELWSGQKVLLMIEASFGTPACQVCLCVYFLGDDDWSGISAGVRLVVCTDFRLWLTWAQSAVWGPYCSSRNINFLPSLKLGERMQQGIVHLIIWRSLLPFSGQLVGKLSRCSIFTPQSSTTPKSHTQKSRRNSVSALVDRRLCWQCIGSV